MISAIVCASLSECALASLVSRAPADDLNPSFGVRSRPMQGETVDISMINLPQTVAKSTLSVNAPNGTTVTQATSRIFTGGPASGEQSPDPTTRFCIQRSYAETHYILAHQLFDQVGDWSVSLQMTYYYGANGYEMTPTTRCAYHRRSHPRQ